MVHLCGTRTPGLHRDNPHIDHPFALLNFRSTSSLRMQLCRAHSQPAKRTIHTKSEQTPVASTKPPPSPPITRLVVTYLEQISRTGLYLIDLTSTANSVDALKQTREVVDESTLDPQPFGFSSTFVFTEQYLVLYEELIGSFTLALVAVVILSLLVLGKVAVVILICVTVVRVGVWFFHNVMCHQWESFD